MRRGLSAMAAVGVMAMLSGCIGLSLYPIYTAADLVFEENLLGAWSGDDVHIELTAAKDAPLLVKNNPRSWFGVREAVIVRLGLTRYPDAWDHTAFVREVLAALGPVRE